MSAGWFQHGPILTPTGPDGLAPRPAAMAGRRRGR